MLLFYLARVQSRSAQYAAGHLHRRVLCKFIRGNTMVFALMPAGFVTPSSVRKVILHALLTIRVISVYMAQISSGRCTHALRITSWNYLQLVNTQYLYVTHVGHHCRKQNISLTLTLYIGSILLVGNLNAHIMRVHNIPEGEPIYGCNYCSCVFKKLGSLNGHMKRMHTDVDEVNCE